MLGNIYGLRKMLNDSSKINTKWTSWKFKYKGLLEKKKIQLLNMFMFF